MDEAPFLELLNADERRAEAKREQSKRREKFSHVTNRTPAEANFLFGLSIEEQVLRQLEFEPFENLRNRLAEGYALQCRFTEAAETATEEEAEAKEYQAKAIALEITGKRCECPDVLIRPSKVNAKGIREPGRHPIEEVFDGEKAYRIFRCRICQGLSAET